MSCIDHYRHHISEKVSCPAAGKEKIYFRASCFFMPLQNYCILLVWAGQWMIFQESVINSSDITWGRKITLECGHSNLYPILVTVNENMEMYTSFSLKSYFTDCWSIFFLVEPFLCHNYLFTCLQVPQPHPPINLKEDQRKTTDVFPFISKNGHHCKVYLVTSLPVKN